MFLNKSKGFNLDRTPKLMKVYAKFEKMFIKFNMHILQKKDTDASFLIFESGAILLLAIAIVVLKLRKSKMLKIDLSKGDI